MPQYPIPYSHCSHPNVAKYCNQSILQTKRACNFEPRLETDINLSIKFLARPAVILCKAAANIFTEPRDFCPLKKDGTYESLTQFKSSATLRTTECDMRHKVKVKVPTSRASVNIPWR